MDVLRNFRFLIDEKFDANDIAKDLRLQLEINRFHDINIAAVTSRNEVIVQVPNANGELEESVESFMNSYQKGVILE
jgi:menaquinone-dependent protoporphyrinogen IX oxidase